MANCRFAVVVAFLAIGLSGCGINPEAGSTKLQTELSAVRTELKDAEAKLAQQAPPHLKLDLDTEVAHLGGISNGDFEFINPDVVGAETYRSRSQHLRVSFVLDESNNVRHVILGLDIADPRDASLAEKCEVALGLILRYAPGADKASLRKMLAACVASADMGLIFSRDYGDHHVTVANIVSFNRFVFNVVPQMNDCLNGMILIPAE